MNKFVNVYKQTSLCARDLSADVLASVRQDLGEAFRRVKKEMTFDVIVDSSGVGAELQRLKEARAWNEQNRDEREPVLLDELLEEYHHAMLWNMMHGNYPEARRYALMQIAALYHFKFQIAQLAFGE